MKAIESCCKKCNNLKPEIEPLTGYKIINRCYLNDNYPVLIKEPEMHVCLSYEKNVNFIDVLTNK
jgi:hypothetical protein